MKIHDNSENYQMHKPRLGDQKTPNLASQGDFRPINPVFYVNLKRDQNGSTSSLQKNMSGLSKTPGMTKIKSIGLRVDDGSDQTQRANLDLSMTMNQSIQYLDTDLVREYSQAKLPAFESTKLEKIDTEIVKLNSKMRK